MCERVGNTIICGRGSRKHLGKCRECWVTDATKLCDGPSKDARGKTCDKPLCAGCATAGGPNVDYCAEHATPASRRLAL
jgi:hypothetical protein